MRPFAVLFVCLANICRSPMAEAAFRREVNHASLDILIDSAGVGNSHIGKPPDPRAQAEALRHGIDISALRARQVDPADFRRFTHILALDRSNLADLLKFAPPDGTAQVSLLLDHVAGMAGRSVVDPFSGKADEFKETWQQVEFAARVLAAKFSARSG